MKQWQKNLLWIVGGAILFGVVTNGIFYLVNYYATQTENSTDAPTQVESRTTTKPKPPKEINLSDLVDEQNKLRTAAGAGGLVVSKTLEHAAMLKTNDMVSRNYWGHNVQGESTWQFVAASGYTYQKMGENLAFGQLSARGLAVDWKNSPTHYRNVVDPVFTEIGCYSKNYPSYQSRIDVIVSVCYYGKPY